MTFKDYVLHTLGIENTQANDLIDAVVDAMHPGDEVPPAFRRTVQELLAWAEGL